MICRHLPGSSSPISPIVMLLASSVPCLPPVLSPPFACSSSSRPCSALSSTKLSRMNANVINTRMRLQPLRSPSAPIIPVGPPRAPYSSARWWAEVGSSSPSSSSAWFPNARDNLLLLLVLSSSSPVSSPLKRDSWDKDRMEEVIPATPPPPPVCSRSAADFLSLVLLRLFRRLPLLLVLLPLLLFRLFFLADDDRGGVRGGGPAATAWYDTIGGLVMLCAMIGEICASATVVWNGGR
mmetsp:Transcript_5873/g.14089  ORF Transcript_5873/g.14089 Transcript_5873/m.14089 type:complete len:238 (+) Transcript_5873:293-1006(+)